MLSNDKMRQHTCHLWHTHTHTYHPCDKSKRKCIAIAICRATAKLIVHEITREFICVLKWARGMMMCGCCCWHHFWRAKWEYIYISVRDWTWARHHAECNGWGSCLTANTRTRSHVMGASFSSRPWPASHVCVCVGIEKSTFYMQVDRIECIRVLTQIFI